MTDLLNQLEQASGGSDELNAALHVHLHPLEPKDPERFTRFYRNVEGGAYVDYWITTDGQSGHSTKFPPRYTQSLDVAVKLVKKFKGQSEFGVDYMILRGEQGWRAYVGTDHQGAAWSFGNGARLMETPALALCIALLRAINAGEGE